MEYLTAQLQLRMDVIFKRWMGTITMSLNNCRRPKFLILHLYM